MCEGARFRCRAPPASRASMEKHGHARTGRSRGGPKGPPSKGITHAAGRADAAATSWPGRLRTRRIRVSTGLVITFSKAGRTVPDAWTVASIRPRWTVANRIRSRSSVGLNQPGREASSATAPRRTSPPVPMRTAMRRRRVAGWISLSMGIGRRNPRASGETVWMKELRLGPGLGDVRSRRGSVRSRTPVHGLTRRRGQLASRSPVLVFKTS